MSPSDPTPPLIGTFWSAVPWISRTTTGVSRQAMAQVIGTLERDGYLERVDDPGDSRAKLVCLSAKGRSVLRLMRASNQSLEREWEAAIGPERLAVLRQIVSDLVNQAA